MKITEPNPETIVAAANGGLPAVETLLRTIQPGVFNLAIRMLGQRNDAEDAAQEILLKVITHLSSFRRESQFSTWVFRIARNHLLTAAQKLNVSDHVSLDQLADQLSQGIAYGSNMNMSQSDSRMLTPEEKVEARHVAINCTQKMLMSLDHDDRLTYLLDTVFGLSSKDAASVLDTSPEAYRQRLSRVRTKIEGFTYANCALVNADAKCRCDRQIPAVRFQRTLRPGQPSLAETMNPAESTEAERNFSNLMKLMDAAAAFRAHPEYQASEAMIPAIRNALKAVSLKIEHR